MVFGQNSIHKCLFFIGLGTIRYRHYDCVGISNGKETPIEIRWEHFNFISPWIIRNFAVVILKCFAIVVKLLSKLVDTCEFMILGKKNKLTRRVTVKLFFLGQTHVNLHKLKSKSEPTSLKSNVVFAPHWLHRDSVLCFLCIVLKPM